MTTRTLEPISVQSVHKWHALAQRTLADLVELYRSGRWRRYYNEETFLTRLRSTKRAVQEWQELLDRYQSGDIPPLRQPAETADRALKPRSPEGFKRAG